MHQLKIHSHHVRGVAYSRDSKWLASASNDQTVRLIDPITGKVSQKWKGFGNVMTCVAFSPSGSTLATAGRQSLRVHLREPGTDWEHTLVTSGPPHTSYSPTDISALGFAPKGEFFFVTTGDRQFASGYSVLSLYNVEKKAPWSIRQHVELPGGIWSASISPDCNTLALGTGLGLQFCTIEPWSIGSIHSQRVGIKALAWSPNGKTLALAAGWSILLWDVAQGKIHTTLTGHMAPVTSLAFTPDGQRLLSGSWDHNVRVWDPYSVQNVATFDWQRGKVQCLAVAPDGMTAAAACDKGIVLWDLDE